MKQIMSLIPMLFAVIFVTANVHAQRSMVRIPLKPGQKSPTDLVDSKGQILSLGDLKTMFDNGADLSKFNPVESKFWQDSSKDIEDIGKLPPEQQDAARQRLELRLAPIDNMAHMAMPPADQGVVYESYAGAMREIGIYAINVRSSQNRDVVYRLKSGLHIHASLTRAALLRKLGIFQESPKYYNKIKVKFRDAKEMEKFISRAFCVDKISSSNINCLGLHPQDRGFITDADPENATLWVNGAYLETMNPEVPPLYDGFTPATKDTVGIYGSSRAYRALIVPFSIADIGESINRFSTQAVEVRGGSAHVPYVFSSDFQGHSNYEDVKWMLEKLSKLSERDWDEIVKAGQFPNSIEPLVRTKIIYRLKNWMEVFFSENDFKNKFKLKLYSLKYSSPDGVIVNGKIMTEKIEGYPQRFAHGERQSPFESGDFIKYLKIKAQSALIQAAISKLTEKLKHIEPVDEKILGIEVGPNGIRPLMDASAITLGVTANADRVVTTGTYYGSQAAVQLVDSVTVGANIGYVRIHEGLDGIDSNFGGGVSYYRTFVHVKPIAKMDDASKTPVKAMYVPTVLNKLTKPLDDGNLTDFLSSLKTGEVFTITDSVGLSGQVGLNMAIDALIGFNAVNPTISLSADGAKVQMRQTQFSRTAEGLQIYVRDINHRAFGLEFNTNYLMNLLKIRSQWTKRKSQNKVYLINFNSALMSQNDKNKTPTPVVEEPTTGADGDGDTAAKDPKDDTLKKKIDQMKLFGNRAALALRALLQESSTEVLDNKLFFQRFEIEHQLRAHELKAKLLWFRSNRLREQHKLSYNKSEIPGMILGASTTNDTVNIVTNKIGYLEGEDLFGFGLEVTDAWLQHKYKNSSIPNLAIDAQNPTQMPFGKARWKVVRADTETSTNRVGAMPQVAVVQSVWGGWSLAKSELEKIIESVKASTQGINFVSTAKVKQLVTNDDGTQKFDYVYKQMPYADFPLFPTGALMHAEKVDFYRVTVNMSILPGGIERIKNLMTSADLPNDTPVEKAKFIGRIFQKLSEKIGEKAKPHDMALYNNLIKIIGNGDYELGKTIYMQQCREAADKKAGPEAGGTQNTYAWLNGTGYECLAGWVEKLIKLSRKFPRTDLEKQNAWIAEVLSVLQEYVPIAPTLNFLEPSNYIFYVEITGFRSKDEDGDEGVYVSNVFGDPNKYHEFANGLISYISSKTKIALPELDQTTGAF